MFLLFNHCLVVEITGVRKKKRYFFFFGFLFLSKLCMINLIFMLILFFLVFFSCLETRNSYFVYTLFGYRVNREEKKVNVFLSWFGWYFCLLFLKLCLVVFGCRENREYKKIKHCLFALGDICVCFSPIRLSFVCSLGKQRWKKRGGGEGKLLLLLLLVVWNSKEMDFVPMIPQNTNLHL